MKIQLRKSLASLMALCLLLQLLPAALADPATSAMCTTGLLPTFLHGSASFADCPPQTHADPLSTDLPSRYDSRDYGYITPVRNQGSFNTCWAFATAACCEAYMIKHGVEVGDTGIAAD